MYLSCFISYTYTYTYIDVNEIDNAYVQLALSIILDI